MASCNLPSCDRRMHKYGVRYIYCCKLTTGKSCFCTRKMFKSLFQVSKLAKGLANAKNTSMLASIITNKYLRVCKQSTLEAFESQKILKIQSKVYLQYIWS